MRGNGSRGKATPGRAGWNPFFKADHNMELIVDLGVSEAVKRELCQGFHAKMNMAAIEQENIGRATAALGPSTPIEGVGQHMGRVQPDIYWRMRQIFGEDCWSDPKFRASYFKHNPAAKVPVKLRKTTLVVNGTRA